MEFCNKGVGQASSSPPPPPSCGQRSHFYIFLPFPNLKCLFVSRVSQKQNTKYAFTYVFWGGNKIKVSFYNNYIANKNTDIITEIEKDPSTATATATVPKSLVFLVPNYWDEIMSYFQFMKYAIHLSP